jgi:hypothetical protein
MFLVMIQNPHQMDSWSAVEFSDLNLAMMAAEQAYKAQTGENKNKLCVKVIGMGTVKVKWGPEDPGGVFNSRKED